MNHYFEHSHWDDWALETQRKRPTIPPLPTMAGAMPFAMIPANVSESWETMAADGFRFYVCLVDKRTGEIKRFASRLRSFKNIWTNRHHPRFPWQILTFIQITK